MKQIISYQIDLNLRFKTHSQNGLILWSGRHTAQDDDDYLLLGIENGYVELIGPSTQIQLNLGCSVDRIKILSTKTTYPFYLFDCRYLHFRYNLGSGEVNIVYNSTKVSDGLWHRIRILR